MLDFYFIPDDESFDIKDTGRLELAGGIEMELFDRLQGKGVIDQRFDYYSDFRWRSAIVKKMHEQAQNAKFSADTDVQHLLKILGQALERDSGLMALCD